MSDKIEKLMREREQLSLYLPYADGQAYYQDVARIRQLDNDIGRLLASYEKDGRKYRG